MLPPGSISVKVRDSSAPNADDLLGRHHVTLIANALAHLEASVRGFVERPLAPGKGRDRLLAEWDRGLEIDVRGGARLRALDAIDGEFHLHLTPPIGSKDNSLHVALPPEGGESRAIVRDHPHAADAPMGFHNLSSSRAVLAEMTRILQAAIDDPNTSRVNRLRAEEISKRIDAARVHVDRLFEAKAAHPELAALEPAGQAARKIKKVGCAEDLAVRAAIEKARGAFSKLSPEIAAQVKSDLAVIEADREKWLAWYASTGLFTFYVDR
jgi:hypothetical protein